MRKLLFLALISIAAACGNDRVPGSEPPPDGPPVVPPTPFTECDNEPPAFVRDTFLAVLGRRPLGQAEINVYVDLYAKAEAAGLDPRVTVANALTDGPEFGPHWTNVVMDAIRVQRTNAQIMESCWGFDNPALTGPALAQQIRDTNGSVVVNNPTDATMLDVTKSALALDDLSTIYRAQLYTLVSRPPGTANVDLVEGELAQRADLGATFGTAWLKRDTVCLSCHNSESSVTDSDDPLLDRHWPAVGLPEKVIYGTLGNDTTTKAHGMFRVFNFNNGGHTPWGLSSNCGSFASPNSIGNDIAGVNVKLGSITGLRTSVYDLDAALKRGFDHMRPAGPRLANGAIADPDEALAWLVTLSITEDVWREITGTPLTIANGFPRNQAASELLQQLAIEFAKSSFSLKKLVGLIVSTDYFSRKAPEAGCSSPYSYPNVFDPWTTSDQDATKRGNGPGDAVQWLSPRTLATAASGALWNNTELVAHFPNEFGQPGGGGNFDGIDFQRSVGMFLRNAEPGFRGLSFQARLAWEDRFGSCQKPATVANDFIDEVLAAGTTTAGATVNDIVLALKDRIINEPSVQTDETAALATLLGPLDGPASGALEDSVRHYCGVLLGAPQFTMSGLAGRNGEIPKLTPANANVDAACARLDGVALGGGRIARCAAGVVTIE